MEKRDNITEDNRQDRPSIFEKKRYIRSFSSRDFFKNIILADNVYVNIDSAKEHYGNTNCIIGSKDEVYDYFIEPNILQMNMSYIIKDYDGRVLSEYSDILKEKGYIVKSINYMDTTNSLEYNVFDFLNYEEDVCDLVSMITKSNFIGLTKGEKLLKNAENLLLEAIIYYIMSELPYEEHNLNTVLRLLKLARPISKLDEEYNSDMHLLFKMLEEKSEEKNIAVEKYKKFLEAAKHMEGIIIEHIENYLSIYSMQSVRKITNSNTLQLDDLFMAGKKVILLIVVPSSNPKYEYIADTFILLLTTYIKYMADKRHCSKLPNKIHLICNNMINNNLELLLKDAYKYNMFITLSIDNHEKLMNYYSNIYEIIDSCSAFICYNYKEEYIKEYIKYKVIEAVNLDTYSELEKLNEEEFNIDEFLEEYNEDSYIVFIQYSRPILGEIYDVEEHDNYITKDVRINKYKLDELKDKVENQIYRNLISEIDLNERSIKSKENVDVDIGAKQFISDEIYSDLAMKLNKPLINDVQD